MSAVDVLAELGGGPDAGVFVAPRRSRWLAGAVCAYVLLVDGLVVLRIVAQGQGIRAPERAAAELVIALFCLMVALVALAVRVGRLQVDRDGVRWGYRSFGFRLRADRIARVRIFEDAIAVVPRQGFTWYLSARDWSPFPRVVDAFARSLPAERLGGRAPLWASLKGYGLALDAILVLNALAATFVFLLHA